MELWYKRPGRNWNEALPLGNGSLGVMGTGGVEHDELYLNHDSLWSGYPRHLPNPRASTSLEKTRSAIRSEDWDSAEQETRGLLGAYTESYLPLGTLKLDFLHGDVWASYRRSLDISEAIHRVQYQIGTDKYERESFVSYPHGVYGLKLTCSQQGGLNFDISLDGRLEWDDIEPSELFGGAAGQILIGGRAPESASPSYCNTSNPLVYLPDNESKASRWACGIQVAIEGKGKLSASLRGLKIRAADRVIIWIAAATTRRDYLSLPGTSVEEAAAKVRYNLETASNLGWEAVRSTHLHDFGRLFHRVELDLGPGATDLSTDERIVRLGAQDPALCSLLFQYGRYLLIASSRPGSLPANLQGIWNHEIRPPWSSNFTININTQMNYWPAWSTNLAECAEPLTNFLVALSQSGERVAHDYFSCKGWCANHNSDAWAHAAPVGNFGEGDPVWAFWPLGGIWLSASLYEAWRYSMDLSFLETTVLPVMAGACQFALDWLIETPGGTLSTAPSTSPEHKFIGPDGKARAVGQGSTIDLCLIQELFTRTIELLSIKSIEGAKDAAQTPQGTAYEELLRRLNEALPRLERVQIHSDGTVMEWQGGLVGEDPQHRHLSHLYGVFPGSNWTPGTSAELYNAALKALDARGPGGTGWSLAWKIALRARFGQGDHALEHLATLLRPALSPDQVGQERGGVYPNLLDACPPFQIDGNFGATAAIALMLVQGDEQTIWLLPALPKLWTRGALRGLVVPGGISIDLTWAEGTATKVVIYAKQKTQRTVILPGGKRIELTCLAGTSISLKL